MDKDNEIDLIQTIQKKDKRIKELEAMSENIGRELLARTDELNEVLEKQKNSVPKDKIRKRIKVLKESMEMAKLNNLGRESIMFIDGSIHICEKLLEEG